MRQIRDKFWYKDYVLPLNVPVTLTAIGGANLSTLKPYVFSIHCWDKLGAVGVGIEGVIAHGSGVCQSGSCRAYI